MSSTATESPIRKVIFLQKIFRFAGRTPKDLVIINSVCKDFEETMQAHHTFNLVLYDNIIKKKKDEYDFHDRSLKFLAKAPAWIVYQWTIVDEHDETQRELLKAFLLFQADEENKILIRNLELLNNKEDPSTTRELFRHVLESCVKLGIVKAVLEDSRNGWNCIMQAVSRRISADFLVLLIESCVQHRVNVKNMLDRKDFNGWNCIMLAVRYQLSVASFKVLLDNCVQHNVDVKKLLEHDDFCNCNCLLVAAHYELDADSFRLLVAHFPSNESFRTTLAVKNTHQKCAVEYAKTEEVRKFLEDPDCWKKCREGRHQQEVL